MLQALQHLRALFYFPFLGLVYIILEQEENCLHRNDQLTNELRNIQVYLKHDNLRQRSGRIFVQKLKRQTAPN